MVSRFWKKFKKYIRLFLISFRHGLILSTTYRISFFIELFVEVGYQFASILTLNIIYQNLHEIVGWNKEQMLVLYGFSLIASEFYVGVLGVWNIWELPTKIKDGDIDFALLKPMSSQFNLTLGRPYFTSILNMLFGAIVLTIGLSNLQVQFNLVNFGAGLLMFLIGIVICYSIVTMVASLSFLYTNATNLGRIGGEVIFLKSYPQQIYLGFWKFLFYLLIPVIFIASVPASFINHGIDWRYLAYGVFIAAVLLFCSIKLWNRMIMHYSSASS